MIRTQRARLRALVALAADAIAPAWPLDTFVAVNPLLGFEALPFGEATAAAAHLYRARTLPGMQRPITADPATLADWCAALGWGDAPATIGERTGRWLAAYLDRGEARWPMPHRELGFFAAWKRLARHENALAPAGGAYRRAIDALPARADDVLLDNLDALAIPATEWSTYLQRHLAQAAGWTAVIKRAADAGEGTGLDVLALLAVRTWYERCEVTALAQRHACAPTFDALRAKIIATIPPAHATHDIEAHATALAQLERRETAFRDALLERIGRAPVKPSSPDVQMVFCIDVRSEPFRHALERAGAIETIGFAGFFGVPFRYRPFDAPSTSAQAPVLLRPTNIVEERPLPADVHALEAAAAQARANGALRGGALGHPLAQFAGVEVYGIGAAVSAARRTFAPDRTTHLAHHHPLSLDALPFEERVFFAEVALRMIGLTRDIAPLVVLCGHGGGTLNNAFAAALDCGACGGNRGLINARVVAAILNDPAVREALAARGIAIPATTLVLAAEHDTTRDTVELLDADAPASHAVRVATLRRALRVSEVRARARRAPALPIAPLGASDPRARAADWAQVRPEWALARNAAIVIGPRALTREVELDGRCFLHSYDPHDDGEGRALEQILTAPLIVAEWINLQYFFATVDPERFGSGDKTVQQPVGGFGVVSGNGGDLRTGLPLQSTSIGDEAYHDPLRLLAVVYAPPARIAAIIARQQVLQRLFDHRWVSLVAIDPHDGSAHRYGGALTWIPHPPTENPACSQTA
jgi:uncharacterized protein YbcC (UPF0753/DUF2309 family)